MNKIIISITFIILLIYSTSIAQEYDIRFGGGLIYGTVQQNLGLNFRGDVKFLDHWSISPHFNIFFNKKNNLVTEKWNAFNVDGHYLFQLDRSWSIYPILGINFATVSEEVYDITYSNAEIGMNLGFGSEYRFDPQLSGFGELKYVISDADQAVLNFGILYKINK